MKCMRCNNEMKLTMGGNYYCPACDFSINDLVYRKPNTTTTDKIGEQITIEDLLKDNNTFSGTLQTGNTYWGQQGWICPKCGRVYSPTTSMCFYCGNNMDTIIPTGTNHPWGVDQALWSTSICSKGPTKGTIKGEPDCELATTK